jgi:hypothetical protein
VVVPAAADSVSAPAIDVTVPASAGAVKVEIPVKNATPGTVAVIVKADGTEEVVKTSVVTGNGVALTVSGDTTVKIIDNSKTFSDVPTSYWAADTIAFTTARNIFSGTGTATFAPEEKMTRGMLAQVLYGLADKPTVSGSAGFTDVTSGAWYADAVSWAAQQNLISGYGDGTFGAEDNVTREQLAFLLWKYAGSPSAAQSTLNFKDADQASSYTQEALKWAKGTGIVSGTGDGVLDPKGLATRAQVAQMLTNFLKQ